VSLVVVGGGPDTGAIREIGLHHCVIGWTNFSIEVGRKRETLIIIRPMFLVLYRQPTYAYKYQT